MVGVSWVHLVQTNPATFTGQLAPHFHFEASTVDLLVTFYPTHPHTPVTLFLSFTFINGSFMETDIWIFIMTLVNVNPWKAKDN